MRDTAIYFVIIFVTTASLCCGQGGSFKKEIPTYRNGGQTIFYKISKDREKQLKLEDIESGYDSIQIRIWYDYSLIKERKLLLLSNKKSTWTGTLYNLKVDWDGNKETIESLKKINLTPKSGWTKYITGLNELQILSLPNMHDIPNLSDGWMDGVTYNVEISTKIQYRFYSYHLPDKFQEFWQAKNMVDILKLNKKEFEIKWEFD